MEAQLKEELETQIRFKKTHNGLTVSLPSSRRFFYTLNGSLICKEYFLHNAERCCMTLEGVMCFKSTHLLEWTRFFLVIFRVFSSSPFFLRGQKHISCNLPSVTGISNVLIFCGMRLSKKAEEEETAATSSLEFIKSCAKSARG